MKYGCHVDLEKGHHPDGCVIDTNERSLCVYACRGIKKEDCEYWRPVEEADKIEKITKEGIFEIAEGISKSWNKGYNELGHTIAEGIWQYILITEELNQNKKETE